MNYKLRLMMYRLKMHLKTIWQKLRRLFRKHVTYSTGGKISVATVKPCFRVTRPSMWFPKKVIANGASRYDQVQREKKKLRKQPKTFLNLYKKLRQKKRVEVQLKRAA